MIHRAGYLCSTTTLQYFILLLKKLHISVIEGIAHDQIAIFVTF